jgi:hypothetical protein
MEIVKSQKSMSSNIWLVFFSERAKIWRRPCWRWWSCRDRPSNLAGWWRIYRSQFRQSVFNWNQKRTTTHVEYEQERKWIVEELLKNSLSDELFSVKNNCEYVHQERRKMNIQMNEDDGLEGWHSVLSSMHARKTPASRRKRNMYRVVSNWTFG